MNEFEFDKKAEFSEFRFAVLKISTGCTAQYQQSTPEKRTSGSLASEFQCEQHGFNIEDKLDIPAYVLQISKFLGLPKVGMLYISCISLWNIRILSFQVRSVTSRHIVSLSDNQSCQSSKKYVNHSWIVLISLDLIICEINIIILLSPFHSFFFMSTAAKIKFNTPQFSCTGFG